ncbi:BCCT family transporter [Streptococcus cuniculipharyngis]|uniref:BCCT family transporter n=1 Tax=Streptococcus cuniculipharyngis TaxID=1562651 RepID=A0A5C5SBY3_9STRE|nr:BCCT family transporter [Streptococcus cuniculipharyngis]TWS98059.1 BCCT family transporter [Streptococcus cuniculipharyngis]
MFKRQTSVFYASAGLVLLLILLGVVRPVELQQATEQIKQLITVHFGWLYLLLVTTILAFCAFFIFSPMGQIRLGEPDSKPEYSTLSWIAMMFSAGMGIGLVFYGAAEPLSHFAISAPYAQVGSQQALADAFRLTFFHYGLHAWAVYGVVALALAYFGFRKQEKYLLSVTLKPLFGAKTDGFWGKLVDTITVLATVIGVATTLGFGAAQINGGLSYVFGLDNTISIQIIIIVVATVLFLLSALSGLGKGVKVLSDFNLLLALLLLAVVVGIGPTTKIFDVLTTSLGNYLQTLPEMSLGTAAFNDSQRPWTNQWTIFYWAWWISWSPFVGVFIARISRGRSIREFLTVVLIVPTLLSLLWFSAFGTLSTSAQMSGLDLRKFATEEILFATFGQYSQGTILSILAIILVMTFFITSADSATFVLGMLTEDGQLTPTNQTKVTWGVALSIMAIVLLLSGGLTALQNILIIVALPFSFVLILVLASLFKELLYEKHEMGLSITPDRYPKKNAPFKSYDE